MSYKSRRWHDDIVLHIGRLLGVPIVSVLNPALFDARQMVLEQIEDLYVEHDLNLGNTLDVTPIAYVTWDATEFLGRKPTKSESAAISRALSELSQSDPPFVQRRRLPREKRKRRVRLTAEGRFRYRQLKRDHEVRELIRRLVPARLRKPIQ